MKRSLLLIPLCLLLFSCAASDRTPDPRAAAKAVISACGGDIDLACADADFIATNLEGLQDAADAVVYYATSNNGTEIGFFMLSDERDISKATAEIRRYIQSEREQTASLAALYPGDELTARLARYDNAIVDHRGKLVYYIIADPQVRQQAINALHAFATE